MSEGYKCRNANHNGDTCVGFCLNISCKHPSQFCLQCMKDQHLDHQDDRLWFVEIKKWLGDLIYVKSILKENLTKIQISFIELMEEAKKNQKKYIDKCLFYQEKIQENNYSQFLENIQDVKVLFHSHNNKSKQEYDIQIVQILKNNEQSKFGYQTKISSINRLFTTCQQLIKSFDEQHQQQSINIQYRQNSPQKRLSSAADYFKGDIEQIPNQKPLGQVATSAQQQPQYYYVTQPIQTVQINGQAVPIQQYKNHQFYQNQVQNHNTGHQRNQPNSDRQQRIVQRGWAPQ